MSSGQVRDENVALLVAGGRGAARRGIAYLLGSLAICAPLPAVAGVPQVIDLSSWTVEQYELNSQPDANWVLSSMNTVATQTVNADASILVSDFVLSSDRIEGTWRVNTSSDDDFIGFAFGYQDSEHFYLFDWKQTDQNDVLGFAERGMSVKRVSADTPLAGTDLWPTAGNGTRVQSLYHNTVAWAEFTDYHFELEFHPGEFTITVTQGATVLTTATLQDSTYTTGRFGFYNYSQGAVVYTGFQRVTLPTSTATVSATPTSTATATETATGAATVTPVDTVVSTQTAASTPTETATQVDSPSPVPSDTPSPSKTTTNSVTPSATATSTVTASASSTATSTPTQTAAADSPTPTQTIASTGTPSPLLQVMPAGPHDFGTVTIGTRRTFTLVIRNAGSGTLAGTALLSGDAGCAPFALTGSPFNLTANQEASLVVGFEPTNVGAAVCAVEIASNGGQASVPLTGAGAMAQPIPVLPSPWSGAGLAMLTVLGVAILHGLRQGQRTR